MNRKYLVLLIAIFSIVLIISGCSKKEEAVVSVAEEPDDVTTASIVDDTSAFLEAVSADGTWIIAVLEDLSIDQEIVLDGQFTHNDEVYRKLAFYAQDENRVITERYTVSAPKMTVKSENARIQGGTFKGDVYVEANGFHLVEGTVDGDIFFATQEYMDSFTMDEGSSVTGSSQLQ